MDEQEKVSELCDRHIEDCIGCQSCGGKTEFYKRSCFDNCPITKCLQQGHEDFAPKYCLADPVIDRFTKRRGVKKPCNTCLHLNKEDRCWRCIHGLHNRGMGEHMPDATNNQITTALRELTYR